MSYLGFEIGDAQIELILSNTNSYQGLIHIFCNALIQSVCRDYETYYSGDKGKENPPYRIWDEQMRAVFKEKHGAFLAEITTEQRLPKLSGSTVVVRGKDYIRRGDMLLYANILADGERRFPAELKNYIAHVAANLAGQNVELIPGILEKLDFENEDPGEALIRLWEQGYPACSGHMPEQEEISRRVWKAQLQSAFAGIEMERLRITEEYAEDIEEAINTEYWEPKWNRSGYVTQHGEEMESASDVELGTMVRMMSLRRKEDRGQHDRRQYLLYFPDEQLRDWIIFLTDCRNNLAHHRVCTPEQMCRLLRSLQGSF